jgi:hypothetical protein
MCCRGPPAYVKFLENVMLGSAQALKCQIKEGRMSYGKCQDPCSTKFSSVDDLKRRLKKHPIST